VRLRQIAHARSGDKGNISNIAVIAFDEAHYAFLVEHVTCERVRALFGALVTGNVVRYECPNIGALNFVLYGALGGGVTQSLALDTHGKSLSSLMLTMELPDPPSSAAGRAP
jgi:hypothetical protein